MFFAVVLIIVTVIISVILIIISVILIIIVVNVEDPGFGCLYFPDVLSQAGTLQNRFANSTNIWGLPTGYLIVLYIYITTK